MEINQIHDYQKLIDEFFSLFIGIREIFSINLNDALKANNYNKMITNKFLIDTELVLSHYNNDINTILQLKNFQGNNNDGNQLASDNNLFIKYFMEYEKILDNNLIINKELENTEIIEGHFSQNITKSKIFKDKKNHEIKRLSDFINKSITNDIEVLFEFGCGKSYLTDALLSTENKNLIYVGVDMNTKLIEKAKKTYEKYKNVYLIDSYIDFSKFNEFYENNMKHILISNNKLNKNIFLFGLHNCGNLTSNTLKIFLQNSYFKSIAIIGCCLHLLKEYISPETKISKDFNDFYKSIGYDKNNKFLDNSLLYDINDDIGYPLSDYIRNKYKHIFFGKDIRNAAMLNNIENAPFDSISTKKNFFRALLQKFLEENLEEYGNIYGLGKNKYIDNCSFLEYVKDFLIQIKTREKNEKILEKIENLIKNSENICTKFYEENKFLLGKHYALNLIRIKFAKIVEYIVSLDRVIFLLEKGINNVNLIRIFNNHISPRNLLIYASKD
jgi:hypothetical protein